MTEPVESGPERLLGRYALFGEIASGGMATVHLGRLIGPVGFAKTVAIKRLHPHLARDPEFVSMFLDEARLAARIHHPNVVAIHDVVALAGEVFLVLDYVQGESISRMFAACRKRGERVHPRVVTGILVGTLHGLHAAHDAKDELGSPLGIVHRDISPQNILVGVDGIARILDFGVAKAAGRMQSTRDGQLKGKLAYMAPEQVIGRDVDRRTDVYSAAVVLWEGLTGERLVEGPNEGSVLAAVIGGGFPPPSSVVPSVPPALDEVVMRGLSQNPEQRFASAREMAIAIERTMVVASSYEIGEWVQRIAADALALRAARLKEVESTSAVHVIPQPPNPAPLLRHDDEHSMSGVSGLIPVSDSAASPAAITTPPPARKGLRTPWIVVAMGAGAFVGLVSLVALLWFVGSNGQADGAVYSRIGSEISQPAPKRVTLRTACAALTEGAASASASATSPEPTLPTYRPVEAPTPTKVAAAPTRKSPPKSTKPSSGTKPEKKPKRDPCDPPFFVDSTGIKQIKPECM